MDPDTTTPDEPQEREKGKLLYFGLKTGQALPILTKEETVQDLDVLVVKSTEGDTYTIQRDQIVWTSSREVDIPTEADVEAYKQRTQARASMGLTPTPSDVAESLRAALSVPGGYL